MKRWNSNTSDYSIDPKIDAFLNEVIEVAKKHGLSISHEDHHGGFIIEPYDEYNAKWLMDAAIGKTK